MTIESKSIKSVAEIKVGNHTTTDLKGYHCLPRFISKSQKFCKRNHFAKKQSKVLSVGINEKHAYFFTRTGKPC